MPLTLIEGWRGDGKTIFSLFMAGRSIRPAYSNVTFKIPNYIKFGLINLLNLPKHIELIMDEGYQMIDSRISMSYVNVGASHIAFQLRKTDTNIYLTVQQLGTIDKRYRGEWDYVVHCERINNGEKAWQHWDFGYTIYDKRWGTINPWYINYKHAEQYFKYFDTNQIIEPRNKSRIEYEILKTEPIELIYRAKEITKEIINKEPKLTSKKRAKIDICLMEHNFDAIWGKEITKILAPA